MQLYQLKIKNKKKDRKRVGRGGKSGTYSGRGIKGQNSRSGSGHRVGFAGGDTPLIKRLPKKRGIIGRLKIKKGIRNTKKSTVILNLGDIKKNFKDNETVSPRTLLEKGLIRREKDRLPRVKVLNSAGAEKIKEKFIFQEIVFSKSIPEKIK